jgi:hypothetical protein
MSRAFVREESDEPPARFDLPARDDPSFDQAAAWALLEGADCGDSLAAEAATGYRWGDPALRPHVEVILRHARSRGDERLEQLAERFLRA